MRASQSEMMSFSEYLSECKVCGNRRADEDGHRPGCPRYKAASCEDVVIDTENGIVIIVTSESLGKNQSFEFDEADEYYAQQVELMKERAPA